MIAPFAPPFRAPCQPPPTARHSGQTYPHTALQADFARTANGATQITAQYGGPISLGLAAAIPDDDGTLVAGYVSHVNAAGINTGFSGHGAYTNKITNPKAVGAAVGTLPTGWIKAVDTNGITTAVVGAGDGYVDIRVSGTASVIAEARVTPAANGITVAAVAGQVWNFNSSVTLLSGAFPAASSSSYQYVLARNSVGASVGGATTSLKITSSPSTTHTMPASTAYVDRYWSFTIANGETVDFTIRISKPQLIQSAYPHPFAAPDGDTIAETSVPATNSTSLNNGPYLDLGPKLYEAMRGKVDGVELWSDAGASGTNWALSSGVWTHTAGSTAVLSLPAVLTVGQRYLARWSMSNRTAGSVTSRAGSTGTGGSAQTTNATFTTELTCAGSTAMEFVPSSDFDGKITVHSIQKLLPADFTCAAIIWHRGAGSAELPNSTRDTFTLQVIQTTDDGANIQVGQQRFNADGSKNDASIVFNDPEPSDGSMGPLGVLRMLYGVSIPIDLGWCLIGTKGAEFYTPGRIEARLPSRFRA